MISPSSHVRRMAAYNQVMNQAILTAASKLSDAELAANRGAFFGSILGTFNHLVVADTIWLQRFVMHPANFAALQPVRGLPAPASLDQALFADLRALAVHRAMLDEMIRQFAAEVRDEDLQHLFEYRNTKGVPYTKNFFNLLMHFFNHQTHHRAQAGTLLLQAGVDVGVTDLQALVPDDLV